MPPKTKTEELTQMSRKRFLQALAGMGLSTGVINHMTQNALAEQTEDPRDEVPRLFGRQLKRPEKWKGKRPGPNENAEKEERWYTIPRKQWVRVETAQDAGKKLGKQIEDRYNDELLTVGVRSEHDRAKSEKRLVINYITVEAENENGEKETVASPDVSFDRVEEDAPYQVTGEVGEGENREEVDVPVSVERRTLGRDNCDPYGGNNYYDDYFDPVPGGVYIEGCTAGAPAYHSDYGYGMSTAGHCFDKWEGVYQPNSDYDVFGTVVRHEYHGDDDSAATPDMCYIDEGDTRNVTYYLGNNDGGTDYFFAGTLAWDSIVDMEDGLQQMGKQGNSTGRCWGDVVETYPYDDPRAFETNAPRDGGDSGGPHFTVSDDYAYFAGTHIGYIGDDAYAGYWEDHYDLMGLTFRQ